MQFFSQKGNLKIFLFYYKTLTFLKEQNKSREKTLQLNYEKVLITQHRCQIPFPSKQVGNWTKSSKDVIYFVPKFLSVKRISICDNHFKKGTSFFSTSGRRNDAHRCPHKDTRHKMNSFVI